jgi:hypothetical protein
MAGSNPAFDPARFRQAIRDTMTMALPTATSERITFRWTTGTTYSNVDPGGTPYDATASPSASEAHADVQIPAAVEFSARPAGSLDTPMGEFDTSRCVVTVMDTDYPSIQGADQVVFDGSTYDVQFVAPPIGLFEVTIYQLYCVARDEA